MNGDFSAGNTGFQSSYPYSLVNSTEGEYTVAANPHQWNPGMVSRPPWQDHTPGDDNLSLLANGSPYSGRDFWRETVVVSSHTAYVLSGWASDVFSGANTSRAQLQAYVNGVPTGSPFSLADGEPNWQFFSVTFDSGNSTSITVALRDLNLLNAANDFAVDDLSLVAVPEPSSAGFLAVLVASGFLRSAAARRKLSV